MINYQTREQTRKNTVAPSFELQSKVRKYTWLAGPPRPPPPSTGVASAHHLPIESSPPMDVYMECMEDV